MGDKCSRILPVCLLSSWIRTRSFRMCWSTGFKYWYSVEDILDFTYRHVINTIGSHGILLWFLDQRSLLRQHSLPRNWNHWWREKIGEEKTCYHTPSSDCRVFDRLCTFHGLSRCCISNQREYKGIILYSDLENAFQFLFDCSLCLCTCYAFRSAHFREGFRRWTSCRKPTPQDDDIQWFRSFFLFKSQRGELEEKLRSENFAATQTIGFDNAE